MLSAQIKDIKLRHKINRTEVNKNISKFLFINVLNSKNFCSKTKKKLMFYLIKHMNKRKSKVKIVRRCVLTNRARVSHRILGVSRIKLKEMLKSGIIPGCVKAVW